MYCRKCGVEVPNNEEICEACRMEQIIIETNAPRLDMSHEGRGAAITSTILSIVGFIMIFVMLGTAATARSGGTPVLVSLLTLGCIIISLLLGINGISAFRRAGRENADRPVASLVCGIIGVVTSGVDIFFYLIVVLSLARFM